MDQTKDNIYEIVYKSYEILIKDLENINFDSLLELVLDYLDLELVWIGILNDTSMVLNKAKGKSSQYAKDESLRSHQINMLKKYAGNIFVSNNILEDSRIFYLKSAAQVYGFNSVFNFPFQIDESDFGFIAVYSKHKNYFDKRTVEILENFSNAVKSAILVSKMEKELVLFKDITENSSQGIVITNSKNEIIYTNKAFSVITGYSFDEAKGKNPSILRSDLHSKEFYEDMWHKIVNEGHFEGKIYNKRKNGEIFQEFIFIKTIKDKDGNILYYFSFFTDLTDLNKAQNQINYYIYHDPLTKLVNKIGFFEQAQRIIEKNESFAVIYIDLDDFSAINANFGIEKGDQLIKEFADFLRLNVADPKDIIGRFGSDEFVFLKRSVIEQNVVNFTRKLTEKLSEKSFTIDNQKVFLKLSSGVVLYPKDAEDINTLVNYAQTACRKAKQLGKNQCVFFNTSIYEEFLKSFELTNEILHGIEFEEFELYFQPIYNTYSNNITHAEALVRWNHPKKGLISPYYFIPFAETSNLIEKLDFYILEKAFQSINALNREGLSIVLSVNLTGRTFLTNNFIKTFTDLMDKYKIDPNYLKIELTESIALSDEEKTRQQMHALGNLGVSFSMDDFGTGYSSILSLKKFPFSTIKLDQNFIMDSQNQKESGIISSHLLNMLNDLNFETTAEGVENEYLFFIFNYLPCDLIQGYYISKPIPFIEFIDFVKHFTPDSVFLEFSSNRARMLDLETAKVKYYIYKYYKTLMNIVQKKLTDKQISDLSEMIELDHKHCDFGKWYYAVYSIYSQIEAFTSMEYIHIDVHKTTEELILEKDKEKIDQLLKDLKYKIMLLNTQFDIFYLQIIKYKKM